MNGAKRSIQKPIQTFIGYFGSIQVVLLIFLIPLKLPFLNAQSWALLVELELVLELSIIQ